MSEPREGRWHKKPLKRRRRWYEILTLVNGSTLIAGAYGEFGPWPEKTVRIIVCGLIALMPVVALTAFSLVELALMRRTRRDRSLSDRALGVEEYAVEIVVWAGRKSVGADRGLVLFDGPLFVFSGERTSFSLAANDLILKDGPTLSDYDLPFYPLRLTLEGGRSKVEIRPLLGQGRRYRRRMLAFIRARAPSDLSRQWPPSLPYDTQTLGIGEVKAVGS